ncbi:hypothetical protein [Streptomyces lavendofoliae]|uniref:Uncharacterized protein n=1 Tax=Streptomyces lavendofoliae TaxID=67314 RepID=A0A918I4Q3_9ACTN|nr:hypothetical protein [Streptomyces lavendofoliae]GGU60268.1 hypothetical protein GCM10010274_56390 [Streptomyces lavendofoliae]
MSAGAGGGPALFIGTGTHYVALVRPRLDPSDEGVRLAAAEAGVSAEEFAGPGDLWAVLVEQDGDGDGFELPGVRDSEPAGFAERLRAGLAGASGPFTVDGGAVLRLDARPAGEAAYAFTARVSPPDDPETELTVETGPVPVARLLADLDAFLGSLA